MTEPSSRHIPSAAATVIELETKVRKLTSKNEEFSNQLKRANQQLNILRVRCDHLEHRLRGAEDNAGPVLDADDEDDQIVWPDHYE